jgi:hypothetical protein
MEKSQVALKLLLDELQLETNIATLGERKTVQKGVYLAQAAGVDLGYRYNWYVMGPYAPSLTRDYFALNEALASGDDDSPGFELQAGVRELLSKVRPMLDVPDGLSINKPEWMELVASIHYLLIERKMAEDAAKALLQKEKGHVAPYADVAIACLREQALISA